MTGFDPIPFAIPGFVLLIALEMAWARRRDPLAYEPRDTFVSLMLGLGSVVAGLLTAGIVLDLGTWLYGFRFATLGWVWWTWLACFLLDDLAYYLWHRAAHRVRWFWAAHVNHHSSQHYNLSTALRQPWTGFLSASFAFRLPIVLLGFPPAMLITCGALNLIYQFWIHTTAIGRMPRWFEAVFNTPSHHRVHHAVEAPYLDRNYAGVLIVWDRLFGTFQRERDDLTIHFGIVRQLGTFNLLLAAFHEWLAIAADVWRAPWRAKLGYVFGPPGWSHDGSRRSSADIKRLWREPGP
ncbi:sterol desaturase family protein [Novosphingobium flavum]|uniref:Sterol desaturase family protein n=1 Tax=Novosphingobium aerophilum TaxID=2839843 RepID=A0A7X1F9R7_9SPHN|nr:sterol desaturase family protein [Novosphingobium aerophilum]MBC2652574.1 sterol desaturase family protein [Novosphingobium aerophilum]MBC2662381.1 sterol desaturase family protein [Novosphingobium aerophilum]